VKPLVGCTLQNRRLLCVAALAFAALAAPALADVAYSFDDAPTSTYGGDLSLGFVFTANTDAVISSLGYYDLGGDGFTVQHALALYSGDGAQGPSTLLGGATLGAGPTGSAGAAFADGSFFRYIAISPVHVLKGKTYAVAGLSTTGNGGPNDPWLYGGPAAPGYTPYHGFTTSPLVTIGDNAARYRFDTPTLINPDQHYSDYQFYAVNFGIAAVPEPATWAMMIVGFGAAGSMLRRRRTASLLA
jgi:hypothetical protein